MRSKNTPTQLKGKALLKKLESLQGSNKIEKAKACGYFVTTKDGKQRVNSNQFMEAILEAQGFVLESEPPQDKRGREASYQVSVHRNGVIIIGSSYTREMGLEPGDEFEIKLGSEHIHLKKIG